SVAMNALATAPGWRDVAIWVMPAAVYALASDTLIGVVRAWAIGRTHATGEPLADTDATPLAVAVAILLWLLRLLLAPGSPRAVSRLRGSPPGVWRRAPLAPRPQHPPPATPSPLPPAPRAPPPHERGQRQAAQAGPAHRAGRPAPRPEHTPAPPGRGNRGHH